MPKSNSNTRTNQSTSTVGVFSDTTLMSDIQTRIASLLDRKGGEYQGSMTDLDRELRRVSRARVPQNWPSSPSVMRKVVNRVVPQLRRSGVSVRFQRETDHMRKRVILLEVR